MSELQLKELHANRPVQRTRPQSAATENLSSQADSSPRKPTGPVTYKVEKGADVWPSRK